MPSAPRDSAPTSLAPGLADTRRGRLAIALQEPLTTIARLRANKQVAADADSFRARIKQVLASAEQDARALGYASEDVRFALFAVIAYLDETVLNSGQAMFANWPSSTLQQEVFGVHMAGELFFQYLESLLARPDSSDLADVLEVFDLCLLMGFKGRYSGTHGGDIQVLSRQLAEKIDRIRGGAAPLAPRWKPTATDIGRRRDPWVRRLAVLAAATVVIAVGLFTYYSVSLRSGKSELRAEAARFGR
jgi:type VI secretion system protein ImpK